MTISWYSISISQEVGGGVIFNGYFNVDNNTNLVTSFYETINGSTNFNNNILIPTGTGGVVGRYLGFATYDNGFATYDNGYLSNWLQFDYYGVIINSMSRYPQYNQFNLWSTNTGDETITNIGIVGNPNVMTQSINSLFTITPMSDPTICFKEGSKILCLNKNLEEEYIPIENLRKDDLVKTLKHGYKAIDMIGKSEIYHSALQERIHNQLYKCSQSKYPEIFEPLIITGHHSILVNDFVSDEQREKTSKELGDIYETDEKYRLPACVDKRASVYETPGSYTIYHLALENDNYYMNYGIYANGLLVETCSKRYLKELSNMTLIE